MEVKIGRDAAEAARLAADWLVARISADVAARGLCVLALSGGETPWKMLEELVTRSVPWRGLQVVQVDERVVPMTDPRRNLARMEALLCQRGRLDKRQLHGIPVEGADVDLAAREYQGTLHSIAGAPPVLDIVQLGLGTDGHTASLFPRDPVLKVTDQDVVATGLHDSTRRVTLTLPCINRAHARLWLITGATKADPLRHVISGQGDSPATRVSRENAVVFTDAAAATAPRAASR